MIKITKVSPRRYEVFAIDENFTYMIYTIKRKSCDRYIVRSMYDDVMIFDSLEEAKAFVRYEKTEDDVNWMAFFVRHTTGKTFENQQESNNHMRLLSKRWKEKKVQLKSLKKVCSLENGCLCKGGKSSSNR